MGCWRFCVCCHAGSALSAKALGGPGPWQPPWRHPSRCWRRSWVGAGVSSRTRASSPCPLPRQGADLGGPGLRQPGVVVLPASAMEFRKRARQAPGIIFLVARAVEFHECPCEAPAAEPVALVRRWGPIPSRPPPRAAPGGREVAARLGVEPETLRLSRRDPAH